MHILFSTRPAFGHVYALMPMAQAARDAGDAVSFATTGPFLPTLRALGFPTHDVGWTIEAAVAEVSAALSGVPSDAVPTDVVGRPDLRFANRLFVDVLARRTAADLAPVLAAHRPDLVVYEQAEIGAAIAAHVAGIPAVCHALSPRASTAAILGADPDALAGLWAEHGRPGETFDACTGDAYLDIIPSVLQEPAFLDHPARMAMRPIPYADPGATVPRWVGRTERPLVYLTLGTVVATDIVLRPAIDGLATLDADVLLALGAADGTDLGPVPANVHVEGFVHQAALWPHVDLAVHHGGSGTLLGALSNGTPQVLLPKGADQFLNADAVAAAGLAEVIEPARATPDAIATAAKAALEEPRPAVRRAQAEIAAMPAPADVLAALVARFG
jgi:UDP:flavonoid glycosyltransferase YjiC (YdhE family)